MLEAYAYVMSRVGVVSDIHGNEPAFNAVLSELNGEVDSIVCLGDIIGICGFPSETISLVREHCNVAIKGNHDILPFEGEPESDVEYVEKQLFFDETTDEQQSWLYSLPTMTETDDGLVLAHSYPYEGESAGSTSGNSGVKPREMIEVGADFEDTMVLLGHVHEQHSVDLSPYGHNVVVVNPGSVGGFYQDVAEYAIIDTDTHSVDLLSTPYNHERVVDRVHELEEQYDVQLIE